MPKSRSRKKKKTSAAAPAPDNRTPVKVSGGPSSPLYVTVMLGLMVLGILWMVLMYLADTAPGALGWMNELGGWNYLIGMGLIMVGLFMTMGWR